MLIQFTVGNFLSYKEPVTFSMITGMNREHPENTFVSRDLKLLKSSVLCGANASGKSNLIKAMGFFKVYVLNSFTEFKPDSIIPVDSFRLSDSTKNKPSYFEIVFIHKGVKYRYGFEIDLSKIHNEWLFFSKKKKEYKLFIRKNTNQFDLNTNEFKEGMGIEGKTRSNALFISVVSQFNGEKSNKITEWFNNFNVLIGTDPVNLRGHTINLLRKNEDYKNKIYQFIKIADSGIIDFKMKKVPFNEEASLFKSIPEVLRKKFQSQDFYNVSTDRKRFDGNNKFVGYEKFDLITKESAGTNKLFNYSGLIVDALLNGKTLVIDELDTSMHPLLTQFIFKLFHSKRINHLNAQLIVATHDIKLLDKRLLRRDQMWFTEKDRFGQTDLYSLLEYKKDKTIRNDASYAKHYMQGRYGAIPIISNQLESLFIGKPDECENSIS